MASRSDRQGNQAVQHECTVATRSEGSSKIQDVKFKQYMSVTSTYSTVYYYVHLGEHEFTNKMVRSILPSLKTSIIVRLLLIMTSICVVHNPKDSNDLHPK